MKKKKLYHKPSITKVLLDREIVLMQTSENTGPGGDGGFVSSSETTEEETTTQTEKTGFDENPFER